MEEYLTNSKGQIMFTNGAKDPYSSRAILKNLSESIVAITATNGSSGWDIIQVKDDDPTWLKECRGRQMKMVKKWVKSHADHSFTHIGIVFYFSVIVTFTLLNI